MTGNASRAFGIPAGIDHYGKPWDLLNNELGWPTAFVRYFVDRMRFDPDFELAVSHLHGKTLLCWCAAKNSERCHALIVREFAELLYHRK